MPIKPKPHQKDALKKITQGLTKHRRAQVTMACGTGKSYVSAWTVQAAKAESVLVLVPSLALVRQLKESFEAVFACPTIAVCSDKTVAGQDTVVVSEEELGCQVTTDPAVVKAHLAQPGKRLVFCTYQSAPRLKGFKFDLGIFDEAHKTAGWQHKAFGFALHDKNIRIKQRVFFTATPRVTRTSNDEVASMDDVKVYGPKVYELPFRKAVKRGIICDYRLIISEINEDVDTQHHAALQVAIQKAMDARGIKKVFAFFRTVEQARVFANDTAGFDPSVTLLHVSGAMSTEERKAVIAQFEKADRAVLTNARCLTEGVDVPAVDMVVFAQAKRATIDIVQAAGRAMRNSPGKQRGYIFLPVWRNAAAGETFETAVSREGFRPVLDTLRALASHDALLESALEIARNTEASSGIPDIVDFTAAQGQDIAKLRTAVEYAVISVRRSRGYWSRERCFERAKKHGTYEAIAADYPLRSTAYKLGCWFEIVRMYPPEPKTPKYLWPIDACVAEASKYKTRSEFCRGSYQVYKGCVDRGLIDQLMPNLTEDRRWTFERCASLVKNYPSITAFFDAHPGAKGPIRKNGWHVKLFKRPKLQMRPLAESLEIASRYTSSKQLKREFPAVYIALSSRKGLLFKLFPGSRKPTGFWNVWENFEKEARKYKNRTELEHGCGSAYSAGKKNGFLDRAFPKKET
jgi:superfamily II DNA or RNA helicase